MRRYTSVRNPIERIRERWGLADAPDQAPPQHFIPGDAHPLPLVARGNPDPYFWPLPGYDRSVLDNPALPSDSGAVDYNARQRSQLDTVPKGEVAEPISVYPNWESRLEGMRDFLGVLEPNPSYATSVVVPGPLFMTSFVVPQGYTAFWKQFRFFFEPVPAGVGPLNALVTLLVDDTPIPNYTNLPFGPFMSSYQDTFIIAGEGRRLTLRVDLVGFGGPLDTTVNVPRAFLYGNVRPRTGESEWKDVGVRMPEPPPPPIAVIAPPAPPAPRPGLLRPGAMPAPPPTQARVYGHGRMPDPNDRGGNRNPPAGRRR